jgi:hypothetical protein
MKFERHDHTAVDIASFEWPAGEGLSVLASSPRRVAERFERARRAGYSTASAAVTRGTPRPGKRSSRSTNLMRNSAPNRGQPMRVWRIKFPHQINGHISTDVVRDSAPHDVRVTYETRQSIGHASNAGVVPDHAVTEEQELREGEADGQHAALSTHLERGMKLLVLSGPHCGVQQCGLAAPAMRRNVSQLQRHRSANSAAPF